LLLLRPRFERHASIEGDASHKAELSIKRTRALEAYLRKQSMVTLGEVTGSGTAAGVGHSPAEYAGDRRAVALPVPRYPNKAFRSDSCSVLRRNSMRFRASAPRAPRK
jgi:hypothetical protein